MIRDQLSEALKTATEKDDRRVISVVRLVQTALKERDLQARSEGGAEGLDDAAIMVMIRAMIEQRAQSMRRYEESGQLELAAREVEEIEVLQRFLPLQLDETTSAEAVQRCIAELGASKLKDVGRVMSELKSRYPGRMDFAKARRQICERLG